MLNISLKSEQIIFFLPTHYITIPTSAIMDLLGYFQWSGKSGEEEKKNTTVLKY